MKKIEDARLLAIPGFTGEVYDLDNSKDLAKLKEKKAFKNDPFGRVIQGRSYQLVGYTDIKESTTEKGAVIPEHTTIVMLPSNLTEIPPKASPSTLMGLAFESADEGKEGSWTVNTVSSPLFANHVELTDAIRQKRFIKCVGFEKLNSFDSTLNGNKLKNVPIFEFVSK